MRWHAARIGSHGCKFVRFPMCHGDVGIIEIAHDGFGRRWVRVRLNMVTTKVLL